MKKDSLINQIFGNKPIEQIDANLFSLNSKESIAYSDGIEKEKELLERIKNAKDISSLSLELEGKINDRFSEYHFSLTRGNLVRHLKINKNDLVLELGCGCGAITRVLGEKGAEVIAIEGSLQRAMVAAERCRDLPNVRIIHANYQDIAWPKNTFDCVIGVGVFEYAAMFGKQEKSEVEIILDDLLKKINKSLSQKGVLALAIENKDGLKYWLGYNEDHFEEPFIGLYNYPSKKYKQVKTYGKKQWQDLIAQAGFIETKFEFPLPDYKNVETVVSDNFIDNNQFADNLFYPIKPRNYGDNWQSPIIFPLIWKNLQGERRLGEFADSFLILAGKTKKSCEKFSNIDFVHYANYKRKAEYWSTTSKNNFESQIVKTFINQDKTSKHQYHDFPLYSTYLLEKSLAGDWQKFISEIKRYWDYLSKNKIDHDSTWWNLLYNEKNKSLIRIDDEWQDWQLVEPDFVLFRSLLYWAADHKNVLSGLGMKNKTIKIFIKKVFADLGFPVDGAKIEKWLKLEISLSERIFRKINPEEYLSLLKILIPDTLHPNNYSNVISEEVKKIEKLAQERFELMQKMDSMIAERDGYINRLELEIDLEKLAKQSINTDDYINSHLLKEAIKKISNKKICLVDFFDTVVVRQVYPEYVKKIVSKRLAAFLGDKYSSEQIYQFRQKWEEKLCQVNKKNGLDLEFSLCELNKKIYKQFVSGKEKKNISEKDFIEIGEKMELEVEKAAQKIDPKVVKFLLEIKKQGKQIILVSDNYLPKNVFQELLNSYKIDWLFDDVFVSSEYLLNKRSGRLYELIIEKKQFRPEDVLMLGDSRQADKIAANKVGIEAVLLERSNRKKIYDRKKDKVNKKSYWANKISKEISNKKGIFTEISLTLYVFIEKLHQDLRARGSRKILFISREGRLLKKLFDQYQSKTATKPIETYYVQVSRRSSFLPSLKSIKEEKFETLFRQYRDFSCRTFLLNMGFEEDEINKLAKKLNIEADQIRLNFPESDLFGKLVNNQNFIDLYEKKRREQNTNFKNYLNSMVGDDREIFVADVGWKGTIQDHIYALFQGRKKITGFYLGLLNPTEMSEKNQKYGLIFSNYPKKSAFFDVYYENTSLFEIMMQSDEGSARSYKKESDEDKIEVVTEINKQEKDIFTQLIIDRQKIVIGCFNRINEMMVLSHYQMNDFTELVAKSHARMIYFPTKKEIDWFCQIKHYENFGLFNYTEFNSQQKISLTKRIANINYLIKNPSKALFSNIWPIVSLINMGLGSMIKVYGHLRWKKIFG